MKKIFAVLFFCALTGIKAQSFYKGALVIDANAGIEIFNTKTTFTEKASKKTETETDRAGNTNFNFGVEYGLLKNVGLGIRFKSDNYFVEKDSTTNTQPNVKGTEILLQANYHVISKNKFDLMLGADFGYSKLKYTFNDPENTRLSGNGFYYSFYVDPRLYFGRFGINLKLSIPFFNYGDLRSNDPDFNKNFTIKMAGTPGFHLGFGVQYRFLDSKEG